MVPWVLFFLGISVHYKSCRVFSGEMIGANWQNGIIFALTFTEPLPGNALPSFPLFKMAAHDLVRFFLPNRYQETRRCLPPSSRWRRVTWCGFFYAPSGWLFGRWPHPDYFNKFIPPGRAVIFDKGIMDFCPAG